MEVSAAAVADPVAAAGTSVAGAPGKAASCSFGSVLEAAFSTGGGGAESTLPGGVACSDGDGASGDPRDGATDPVVEVAMALLIAPTIPTAQQATADPGVAVAPGQLAISAVGAVEAGAVSATGGGGFGGVVIPVGDGTTSEGRVVPSPGEGVQPDVEARMPSAGSRAPDPGVAFDVVLPEGVDARRVGSVPVGAGIPASDDAGSMMGAGGGPLAEEGMPARLAQQAARLDDGPTATGLSGRVGAMPGTRVVAQGDHPARVAGGRDAKAWGIPLSVAGDGSEVPEETSSAAARQELPVAGDGSEAKQLSAIEPGRDDLESVSPEPAQDGAVIPGTRAGAVGAAQEGAVALPLRPVGRKGGRDADPKVDSANGSSHGALEGVERTADGGKEVIRQERQGDVGDVRSHGGQAVGQAPSNEGLPMAAGRPGPAGVDGAAQPGASGRSSRDAEMGPASTVGPVALSGDPGQAEPVAPAGADRVQGGQNGGEDLFGQLLAHAAKLGVPRNSSLRVQLRPPSLGLVDLRLGLKDGVLTLQILAESDRTREMIQQALPDLRQHLEGKSIEVGQMSLGSTATGPSGQQYGGAELAGSGHWSARRYGHGATGGAVAEEPPGAEGRGSRDGRPDPTRLVDYRV